MLDIQKNQQLPIKISFTAQKRRKKEFEIEFRSDMASNSIRLQVASRVERCAPLSNFTEASSVLGSACRPSGVRIEWRHREKLARWAIKRE